MKKNKKIKRFVISLIIFSLVAMYGFMPPVPKVNAIDSIIDAQDLIGSSQPSVYTSHTFQYTLATTTPANGYVEIVFPAAFGTIASNTVDCVGAAWASSTPGARTVRCTTSSGVAANTQATTTISSLLNPSTTGTQYIEITQYDSSGNTIGRVTVAVAIVEKVLMTARVSSSLTFTVSGLASGSTVNGINCSNTSTATATPFGTLTVNATSTVCQQLNVTTNADDGFIVTVEQNHELQSDSGSNINSFNNSPDNTGSTTAQVWQDPLSQIDQYHTYGHMGLTSDDQDLSSLGGYNDFYNSGGTVQFAGLNSTDPMVIMHHNGPSDGSTQNIGLAKVLYAVKVGPLQEAGDYESTLTYIVTPTY